MAVRVFLANSHELIREGLKSILSKNDFFNICGEYTAGGDIISNIEHARPNLLLFDISREENAIVQNFGRLRLRCPGIRLAAVLFLADYRRCYDYINGGEISGFFCIDVKKEELYRGLIAILSNKIYIQESVRNYLNTDSSGENLNRYKINSLTERETEVLNQVAKGMLNKEIATVLNISERTVKNHLSSIFKKIEVSDRTQAAMFAVKNGIVNGAD